MFALKPAVALVAPSEPLIRHDMIEASKVDVSGTPNVFVDKTTAQGFEDFVFEGLLK